VLSIACWTANCSCPRAEPAHERREITARTLVVERIVDGDTFATSYDADPTYVQIWGIDAPEPRDPKASAATAALPEMIDGRTVRLSFPGRRKRDSFCRPPATVEVDGADVVAGQ